MGLTQSARTGLEEDAPESQFLPAWRQETREKVPLPPTVSSLGVQGLQNHSQVGLGCAARAKRPISAGVGGGGSPILGQLWLHLFAGKEQLVLGGKAPRGVITPVPKTGLLARFSVPTLLPEPLLPLHPLSSPILSLTASGPFQGKSPQMHRPCCLGSGKCV